jgi:hypothetical protein
LKRHFMQQNMELNHKPRSSTVRIAHPKHIIQLNVGHRNRTNVFSLYQFHIGMGNNLKE